jgi:hypothetical protein
MTDKIHLWPEPVCPRDEHVISRGICELTGTETRSLWYRVPQTHAPVLSQNHDHLLVGYLFTAMRTQADLVVHGSVSPSLLQNLERFMATWAAWRPDRYARVMIVADREEEHPPRRTKDAVTAFSGGVDSCFTISHHARHPAPRQRAALRAAMMVHGFDIPLEANRAFETALDNARAIVKGLDLDVIPVATNFHELDEDWEDAHGAAIASCLMLLQGGYCHGLIGSTEPYTGLVLPWGSNPITDPMLSSQSFEIVHDGAALTRTQKIRELADWPEALQHLRVCWEGPSTGRNCGQCEKCIRTILNFRAVGLDLPPCFDRDIGNSQIMGLRGLNAVKTAYLEDILASARSAAITDPWVGVLARRLRINRLAARARGIKPLRWCYRAITLKGIRGG